MPAALALSGQLSDAQLRRIAALGCDYLLPLGCETGESDGSALQQAAPERAVAELARRCSEHGLNLLLELAPAAPAGADSAAPWRDDLVDMLLVDMLPDPRRADAASAGYATATMAVAAPMAAPESWIEAGINTFHCRVNDCSDEALEAWRQQLASLRAQRPGVRAIAQLSSRPGAAPAAALRACGFDAVYARQAISATPGPDAIDDLRLLRAVAPVIAYMEAAHGARLAAQAEWAEAAVRPLGFLRALQLAGLCGDGLLVLMGFEYGLEEWVTPYFPTSQFLAACEQALFDLSPAVRSVNRQLEAQCGRPRRIEAVRGAEAAAQGLLIDEGGSARLALVNHDLRQPHTLAPAPLRAALGAWQRESNGAVTLAPGEVKLEQLSASAPVRIAVRGGKRQLEAAARAPRVAIEAVTPQVDGGRFAVKATVGTAVRVGADIFSDGHDILGAALAWRSADTSEWQEVPMAPVGNDRWEAMLSLQRIGSHRFAILAWRDAFATYRDELQKKCDAGLDLALELEEGRRLLVAALAHEGGSDTERHALSAVLAELQAMPGLSAPELRARRLAALLAPATRALVAAIGPRDFLCRSAELPLESERRAASFSSWYELFPRSQSGDLARHGTFDDVIARLPAIVAMGFDTLYMTPIHPIGRLNRKGRNNSLHAQDGEPGSPYAIGAAEGGHDAIHPQLGTLDDFRRLRDAAAALGLELALDFAVQCAPDHPWLQQHPQWFAWRPDGSLRYAENPPKKYQDIVNVEFYAEQAVPGLWLALRDVVLFWVGQGVRAFRVDNPHTKPLPFWEWLIAQVRNRAPDTVFLSEAFTRPKPMYRLAKLGFSQSYTYFTWRHDKRELTDYITELCAERPDGAPRDYFRPHFFVNTPDINPFFLQRSGRAGFLQRAALACTLSGLWGMYNGFELCEAQALPGREEYQDSEKYQLRSWDWQRPDNIVREIAMLNRIRRAHPALQSHLTTHFLPAASEHILLYAKAGLEGERFGADVLIVAVNLDPFAAHDAAIELPLWRFGLPDDGVLAVVDLMRAHSFSWHGKHQHIYLDPSDLPFAIWHVQRSPS